MPIEVQARWTQSASRQRVSLLAIPFAGMIGVIAGTSHAACTPTVIPASGTSVACDGVNTGSTNVIALPGSTNVTITVSPGATLTTNATQALLVEDASTIINHGQITVSGGSGSTRFAIGGSGNNNILINNGGVRTTSGSTAGMSIAVGGSSTGTQIRNNGSILTTGGSSHGIVTFGPGNMVANAGTISVSGTAAKGVFLQGGNMATNVLVNTGTIAATGANTSPVTGFADGVHANTTGSTTFFSRVENRAGGIITSANSYALRGQNGNDTFINAGYLEGRGGAGGDGAVLMGSLGTGALILQTGSVIRGAADGGIGKSSSAFLEGSGTVDNAFRNFQHLTMRGSTWAWTTDASFAQSISMQTGTFTLSSRLASPVISVLPGAVVAGTGTLAGDVSSQGTLQPGPGAGNGYGALTVQGNYTGVNALLQTHAALGSDGSPSDRLVIDGGLASGHTGIRVVNQGGTGALTVADGILVVQTVNSGTTGANAFSLAQPADAGAYSYHLFRGDAAGNNTDNWYLRSTGFAVAGTVVGSASEAAALAAALQPPGEAPLAIEQVELYRPEVALYSAVPQVVRHATLTQLGTFHERQGHQQLLKGGEGASASWGRVFGQDVTQALRGDVDPRFDGTVSGVQLGHDVYARMNASEALDRLGVVGGYVRSSGKVNGLAGGLPDVPAGRLTIEGYTLGGYWTRVGRTGWYTDTVLSAGLFSASARSTFGRIGKPDIRTLTASIEGGYPFVLNDRWVLEPQAQLIWQRNTTDRFDDGVSAVALARDSAVTARIGARLQGDFGAAGHTWKPYLKVNLWHTFSGSSSVMFGVCNAIRTRRDASALEVGVGIAGQINRALAVYGGLAHTTATGKDSDGRSTQGQVGMRYTW